MRATGKGHSTTLGFREVLDYDCSIGLWGFLHLDDQMDEAVSKYDKIYKVRPMIDGILPLFRCYYSPHQQLSLEKGMIPTKNPLAIKQYIRRSDGASKAFCCARPRWATFLMQKSTWARSRADTAPSSDHLAVLLAVSWRTHRWAKRTTCCSWTVFTTLSHSSTC